MRCIKCGNPVENKLFCESCKKNEDNLPLFLWLPSFFGLSDNNTYQFTKDSGNEGQDLQSEFEGNNVNELIAGVDTNSEPRETSNQDKNSNCPSLQKEQSQEPKLKTIEQSNSNDVPLTFSESNGKKKNFRDGTKGSVKKTNTFLRLAFGCFILLLMVVGGLFARSYLSNKTEERNSTIVSTTERDNSYSSPLSEDSVQGNSISADANEIVDENITMTERNDEESNSDTTQDVLNNSVSPSTTVRSNETRTYTVVGSFIAGEFTEENQKDRYSYKAPISGKYRFILDIENENYNYSITIKNSKSANLASGTSSSNSKAVTVTLEEGSSYVIEIAQDYGLCGYTIMIGVPNAPKNVSGTEINGSITYVEQRDVYYYSAPIDGYYRFNLDISNVNNNYKFTIIDSKEQRIASCSYSSSGHGTNANLKANEKYRIVIDQDYRLCDYTITIGVPTAPTQITGNQINGSLDFEEQKDTYYYTAPRTGRYIFKLSSGNTNADYNFKITKPNNSSVRSTHYASEKNINTLVNLTEGEKYTITVEQNYLLSSYEIAITPPAAPISLSGNSFSGSFEYKDQYFTYQFSVDKSGTYSFDFEQFSLDFVVTTEVQECSTGQSIKTGRIYRGSESFYAKLESGKQYYLKVYYESYLKSFSGSINFYRE